MAIEKLFDNFYCMIFPYIFLKNNEGDVNWALTFIGTFNLLLSRNFRMIEQTFT